MVEEVVSYITKGGVFYATREQAAEAEEVELKDEFCIAIDNRAREVGYRSNEFYKAARIIVDNPKIFIPIMVNFGYVKEV